MFGTQNQTEEKKCKLRKPFRGVCVDSRAAKSVCGRTQAEAYRRTIGKQLIATRSNRIFKLGDNLYLILGQFSVRIPSDAHTFVEIQVHFVEANVPLLIGLSDLKKHGLVLNYLDDVFTHMASGLIILVRYKNGQV